ncbi:porin [Holophaga foetida]|uniref:porin n=1 Tax=Holophaga foetida TaxID=35839 RepID=UPI0002474CBC|nr:porin [Holophaga foetida]
MKNRLTLALVAGAIATPLLAADTPKHEWSLYGTLVTELNNVKVTGSSDISKDLASRNRFSCATSNVGFKGSFQATEDIKVIWQLESAVGIDGDQPSTWAGRNTALGLQTKFGTILAGLWDTPYKDVVMKMGALPASLSSDVSIMTTPGFRTIGTTSVSKPVPNSGDAIFNRRQGNSVQYWSPVIGGLQAKVLYSVNEGKSAANNPTLLSGTLSYQYGPLTLIYGYEEHRDYYGLQQMINGLSGASSAVLATGGTTSKDTGNLLAAYVTLPTKTRICGIVEQLNYTIDGATAGNKEYKRTAWYVIASQELNAHKFWAGYGAADKGTLKTIAGAKVTTGSEFGAKQYTLGYAYSLIKGVSIFANVFGVINDKNGSYSPMPPVAGGAAGASTNVYQGGDTKGLGGGLLYKF